MDDGVLVRDVGTIVGEISGFKKSLYIEDMVNTLMIEGLEWSLISE